MENVVKTLIAQHGILKNELIHVSSELGKDNPDIADIDITLKKFAVDLTEHLKLENEVFYVEVLKKMKENGMDTNDTKTFIDKMQSIEAQVGEYLNQYDTAEKIKVDLNNFKITTKKIIEALVARIELEESGVYLYWSLANVK